jgi:hypothetical protein
MARATLIELLDPMSFSNERTPSARLPQRKRYDCYELAYALITTLPRLRVTSWNRVRGLVLRNEEPHQISTRQKRSSTRRPDRVPMYGSVPFVTVSSHSLADRRATVERRGARSGRARVGGRSSADSKRGDRLWNELVTRDRGSPIVWLVGPKRLRRATTFAMKESFEAEGIEGHWSCPCSRRRTARA